MMEKQLSVFLPTSNKSLGPLLRDKTILITGGTGSLGQRLMRTVLDADGSTRIVILSRDELKQQNIKRNLPKQELDRMTFIVGDVRDPYSVKRAMSGVHFVCHTAALKHVTVGEENPLEFIKTNILGTANVIDAAEHSASVERMIVLSTDKAAGPVNLYGATKMCAEKLVAVSTKACAIRYGNVLASRGSVVPFFIKKKAQGILPITDFKMTRFWITLEEAVDFCLESLFTFSEPDVFIPRLPSVNITDLAKAIAPEAKLVEVGRLPGEKLSESLVSQDESYKTVCLGDRYCIKSLGGGDGKTFQYASGTNDTFLSVEEIRTYLSDMLTS